MGLFSKKDQKKVERTQPPPPATPIQQNPKKISDDKKKQDLEQLMKGQVKADSNKQKKLDAMTEKKETGTVVGTGRVENPFRDSTA